MPSYLIRYHVLKGMKRFYLIEPTLQNLSLYKCWITSPAQETVFLADMLAAGECYYVDLEPGNTLIIPSGWIHAVYTPIDSFVIGGNFLHSSSIVPQLQIFHIEATSRIHKKYLFPYFQQIMWYSLCGLLSDAREAVTQFSGNSIGGINESSTSTNTLLQYPRVAWQVPHLVLACHIWTQDIKKLTSAERVMYKNCNYLEF